MRNILVFIYQYQNFLLFVVLESLCFYLLMKTNPYHRTVYLSSANELSGNIAKVSSDVENYFELKEQNESLAILNAELMTELEQQNIPLYTDLDTTGCVWEEQFTYTNAKVINNSVTQLRNYITLNVGENDGIASEMCVISKEGIVGIVNNVSEHFCTVISLLHRDIRISAALHKSGHFGSIVWEGEDPNIVHFIDIPKHVQVAVGDTIVSTSYSAIFPEGLPIGYVKAANINQDSNFYDIVVQLAVDFSKLNYVYVVNNIYRQEIQALEAHNN
ncbi:MAG: rod shape-determining protein MreC [Chitinophagales bacterium]|nr:rod shape-determining protein MreC [Bacteroidota bacterium]